MIPDHAALPIEEVERILTKLCPHNANGSPEDCLICGKEDCPFGDPMHYMFNDGCPTCYAEGK